MSLLDFQSHLNSNIRKSFSKNRRVIGQLPTGGGKTYCIADIVARSIAKGNVVCVSCHRIEIFESIYHTLKKFGIQPSLIAQGQNPMPGAQVYLAMVETVCRRMQKGLIEKLNINFFILDEVHLGNYYKLVTQLNCNVLGFTATPKSTGSPELNEYFDDIVCGASVKELIDIGRLVPATTFS